MLKNYFLITVRNLFKNKVFILINILGMSIAIGCCIVAYYNYQFNAKFDGHHVKAATIYRVNSAREFQNRITEYGYVPMPLGDAVKQNIGDIEKVIRYTGSGADFRIGEEIFGTRLSYVDQDFFSVFTFDLAEGNATDLKDKSKIFISEDKAMAFFGKNPALGKTITMMLPKDQVREFTVGGVFKNPPANSSFNGEDAFTVWDNYYDIDEEAEKGTNWKYRSTLFVVITNDARKESITAQLKPYAENNNKVRDDFKIKAFVLDPLVGMAARDTSVDRPGTWTRNAAPIAAVMGCAIMGILILLIACFNLTNTAISVSSKRLKEIGIRKVMGGLRSQLITQFLGETMLICFVSLMFGMIIAEYLLIPAFNSLWPYMKLTTNYIGEPGFLFFMIGTLAFTGLLAGSYPALYVTKFQPISILKGTLKFGGTSIFTRVLLTLQFSISLVAIVCSFAFTENARYQRDFDLGFDHNGVVFTYVNSLSEFETFKNAIAGNQDIVAIAGSKNHIFSSIYNDPIKSEGKEIEVDIMDVGENYLKTMDMHLTEGRDFVKESATDYKESVIVTEKLVRQMGWSKGVGKEIVWMDTVKLYVVGVIKDSYTQGLWRESQPLMMRFAPKEKYSHIIVSTGVKNLSSTNKFMEKKWKEIFPNRVYNGRFMQEGMAEAVQVNTNIVKMFVFLGIVAMMLSATGLFTLVSLNILKKMKEIGIRKVFGASVANITRIINTEFVIILLLASAVGCVGGAKLASLLMGSIWKYYQGATVTTLVFSVVIMLTTSACAIMVKVYRAATMNPVKTLRDE